ncbi:MAG: MerR family transcriptional regulator [Acidobacteriota bacterium]|nr:MerR family transcriptional regulator [Acidobacteriota bacterium]
MAKEKLYYKIGEACKMLDIQPYVLRYWETEFPVLNPSKSKSGQRVYDEDDFALIRRIKELLYEEGFTIAGAKKKLEAEIEAGGIEAGETPAGKPAPRPRRVAPPAAKPAGQSTAKATASAPEAAPSDTAAQAAQAEELARLRAGIDKALAEAREILEYLQR